MMSIYIFVLIFLTLSTFSEAAEFNIFKSYADSKVKPPQYSTNPGRKKHPLNEYLSGRQEMMMKLRKQENPSGYMFSENWSGFDPEANAKITPLRRLTAVAPLSWVASAKASSIISYGVVMILVVLGFTSYKTYFNGNKDEEITIEIARREEGERETV